MSKFNVIQGGTACRDGIAEYYARAIQDGDIWRAQLEFRTPFTPPNIKTSRDMFATETEAILHAEGSLRQHLTEVRTAFTEKDTETTDGDNDADR